MAIRRVRGTRARLASRRLLSAVGIALAVVVLGAFPAEAEPTMVLALVRSIGDVITNIRNWLIGILAGLATLFLTVGGVRYLLAGGDPGEVEKAKQAFKNAGFSYALAALAPVVVEILRGRTTRGTIARLFGRRTGAGGGDVPSAPGAMVTRRARPRSAPSSRAYETRDIGVQSVTS